MTTRAAAVAVLACAALIVGCGPKTPDYQSIWTTSSTATAAPESRETQPVSKYLEANGVSAEQVAPSSLTDLAVSIPTPAGWSKRESEKLPPGTEVIAKGERYPTAVLMVFKLNGDVDAAEVVKHGFADVEQSPKFNRLDSSTDDFHGFPSAMIQGSHELGGQRVHTWYRMVVPTGSPPGDQHYLVQLTIITQADQAAAQAGDVEAIIDGFTVAAK